MEGRRSQRLLRDAIELKARGYLIPSGYFILVGWFCVAGPKFHRPQKMVPKFKR